MIAAELIQLRLANQLLLRATPLAPEKVVRRMVLIQAQDFLGSLWAVGLRSETSSEAVVEQALNERRIIRTWPARGTLHFVSPEDVHWILKLLAPRIISASRRRNQQLELDEETFTRSRLIFEKSLQGGKQLTREEIYSILETAQISTEGQRGYHILWRMGQERLICFGPRHGKQPTFVLLDEWIPQGKSLDHDEALREITLRYFAGHGPATIKDFTWWSGLSAGDAKVGLELAKDQLHLGKIGPQDYWFSNESRVSPKIASHTILLPPFDEYNIGYADRSLVLESQFSKYFNAGGGILHPVIIIGGIIVGTWKRTLQRKSVQISAQWFIPPSYSQKELFKKAAKDYADFLELSPRISEEE